MFLYDSPDIYQNIQAIFFSNAGLYSGDFLKGYEGDFQVGKSFLIFPIIGTFRIDLKF